MYIPANSILKHSQENTRINLISSAVKKVLRKNVFFQKYLKNLILCFRARKGSLSCCFEKCFKALSYMNLKFETVRGEVLTFAFIYILFLNYMHDLRKLKCPSSLLLIITHWLCLKYSCFQCWEANLINVVGKK